MKRVLTILLGIVILFGSCASQQNTNCGSKAQKKAKYKSMKNLDLKLY